MSDSRFHTAAQLISQAKAIIITAGAGMGVDSGLPDFRGDQGFWNAYPMYERLGLSFVQAANPEHFEGDPHFGWGFYGHRTNLYRSTIPHQGFHLLQQWIDSFKLDHFIVTSNVDGQFQKAGFSDDRILEIHGSIHHLQCTTPCSRSIWPNHFEFNIDEASMTAQDVPLCPQCRSVARPNILMFGDYAWLHQRTFEQENRFDVFLSQHRNSSVVVVEMGAGTAVPSIRHLSEKLGRLPEAHVLRINPREPQISAPHISFSTGALESLVGINTCLN